MKDFKDNITIPVDNDPLWDKLEANYNKHFISPDDKVDRIPKKIHQIWLGGEVPDKYQRLRETWIKLHPDWEYKLWGDEDAEKFGMINDLAFRTVKNYGAKADIFRYEILYREGGVYADTDFECIKSFNDFIHLSFFSGSERQEYPFAFNGLIGCIKQHDVMFELISLIKEKNIRQEYGWDKIMALTGPDCFAEVLLKYISSHDDDVVIFPTNYFYPMPNNFRLEIREDNEMNRKRIHSYIKPMTYAIHLWYTSWQTYRYNVASPVIRSKAVMSRQYECECGTKWTLEPEQLTTCPTCLVGMRWVVINKRGEMTMVVRRYNKQKRRYNDWITISG
jgi:mannosyltransferase OCH1-like enzyme